MHMAKDRQTVPWSKVWAWLFTRGGGAVHPSTCTVKIHPDGGVESFWGTQDLGAGTKTICAQVLAETFGLQLKDVKVNLASSIPLVDLLVVAPR